MTKKSASQSIMLLRVCLVALTVVLLPACKTVEEAETAEDASPKKIPLPRQTTQVAELYDDSPLKMDSSEQEEASGVKREEVKDKVLVERKRGADDRPGLKNRPFHPSSDKGAPDDKVSISLNLQAATVEHIVMAFADKEVLDFNYLVDPAVKGAISLNMDDVEMTRQEAWELLEHLLWLSGAYMSETNNFVHILPFEKMPKEQRLYVSHDKQPNVQAVFLDIRYRKSADVINFLKPFMTDGATAVDIADSNTIVLVETPNNVEKLLELVKRLDSKGEGNWPVRCIACREVDPETLAAELQSLLPILGFPVAAAAGPSGGAIKLMPLPRMNAIVVSASMEEVLDEVTSWVRTLDKEDVEDKECIYFYNVKYSTVDILSASLDAFFQTTTSAGPTTSSSSKSSGTSTTSSSSRRSNSTNSRNSSYNSNRTTMNGSSRSGYSSQNRNTTTGRAGTTNGNVNGNNGQKINPASLSVFETDVFVFTEEESNRLTIKTTPRVWNTVKAFLERQDVAPRQVAIHAIITEIRLDESLEFGVSYAMDKWVRSKKTHVQGAFSPAGAIADFPAEINKWGSAGLGLLFTDADNDPMVMLKAIAGTGNTKILSEPQIVAKSGATAELQVGQSVPLVKSSVDYVSSEGNTSRSYEYTETGIIMSVTPFITAGNEVRLEIEQEISSVAATTDAVSLDTPTLDKKKMSTEVIVPDNSTILMGGMIKNEKRESYSGIPYLKDIPYIGFLFRANNTVDIRSEVLVLVTVNVIDNKQPQEELIRRYKASLDAIEEHYKKEQTY